MDNYLQLTSITPLINYMSNELCVFRDEPAYYKRVIINCIIILVIAQVKMNNLWEKYCCSGDMNIIAGYPKSWILKDGRSVILRPIRSEDKPEEKVFIEGLSSQSSRYRFFDRIKEVTPEMLHQFCDIDYEHVIAIMAEYIFAGEKRNVGVGRLIMDTDMQAAEFAVVVADDFQNNGLGRKLISSLIDIGREKGLKTIYGMVMRGNYKMLGLARKLGFNINISSDVEARIVLYL